MRIGLIGFVAGAAVMLTAQAQAFVPSEWWEYRDWRVHVERWDTGEDFRVSCTAITGGDGDPALIVSISNGDALPPYGYPDVRLSESAPRGYRTMMQNGDAITVYSNEGYLTEASVFGRYDEDGIAVANASIDSGELLGFLREMRVAASVDFLRGKRLVYTASLRGFTAAYGKMAEQCGFSARDVIR